MGVLLDYNSIEGGIRLLEALFHPIPTHPAPGILKKATGRGGGSLGFYGGRGGFAGTRKLRRARAPRRPFAPVRKVIAAVRRPRRRESQGGGGGIALKIHPPGWTPLGMQNHPQTPPPIFAEAF